MTTTPRRRPWRRATAGAASPKPKRGFLQIPRWVVWVSVAFLALGTLYDFYVSVTNPSLYMQQPGYSIGQLFFVAVVVLAPFSVPWAMVVAYVALAVSAWNSNGLTGLPVIMFTLFVLGIALKRRWQLYFGIASVAWVIILMFQGTLDWVSTSFFAGMVLVMTGFGTVIGEFRARHNKEVDALEARAEEARSRERRLLARELHDVVAHELTIITMQSHVMQAATKPDDVEAARSAISSTAGNALGELKRLLAVMNDDTAMLRVDRADQLAEESAAAAEAAVLEGAGGVQGPPTGDDADLGPLIDRLVGQMQAVGFTVEPEVAVAHEVPRSVRFAAGRLLREAATNVLKYGDTEVPVRLLVTTRDGEFVVDVVNGLPEVERANVSQTGLGLTGLAERVRLLGGHLELTSEERTWRLRADIPLDIDRHAVGAGDAEAE